VRQRVDENKLRRRALRLGLRLIKVQGAGYYIVPITDRGRSFAQMDRYIGGEEKKLR
jgi:hypothetical protein